MKVETTYSHYVRWLAHKHQLNTPSSTKIDVIYDRLYGIGRLVVSYVTKKPFSVNITCSDDQMRDALTIFHQNTPLETNRSSAYDQKLERYLSLGEEVHGILLKYIEIENSHEKYNDYYNETLSLLMNVVTSLHQSFTQLTFEIEGIQNSDRKSYSNDFKITSQREYGNIRKDYQKLVVFLNQKMVLDLEYAKQQLLSYMKLPHDKSFKQKNDVKTVYLPNKQSFSHFHAFYTLLSGLFVKDLSEFWSNENKERFELLRNMFESCHFEVV